MSYCKYDSRMSQHYLNQNLIVSLTLDFFENRAPGRKTTFGPLYVGYIPQFADTVVILLFCIISILEFYVDCSVYCL